MAKVKKDIRGKVGSWLENNGPLAGVALIILLVSLSLFLPKDRFQQAKERLVRNPNDFEAHLILAEKYLNNNQLEKAEKELLLAQKIQPSSYQVTQLWQRMKESNPEDIKELIKGWEQIVSEKPDYRDAYLQLALFHYKLYENEKAKDYLQKALELDPNFEPAKEMEKILKD